MELGETPTHSFIIKVWLEEAASESQPAIWRGHITHVPSHARRYIKDITEILRFINPYLEEMSVPVMDLSLPRPFQAPRLPVSSTPTDARVETHRAVGETNDESDPSQ